MTKCMHCGAIIKNGSYCEQCSSQNNLQYNVNSFNPTATAEQTTQNCARCAAIIKNGSCEYCGWNIGEQPADKTLFLSGLLCNLTVNKDTSTFKPKVGTSSIIKTEI